MTEAERAYIAAGIGYELDTVVAKRLGVSREAVRQMRNKLGLPRSAMPTMGERAANRRRARIVALIENGLSAAQVAVKIGVTRENVYAVCREFGVKPKRHGNCKIDWSRADWTQNNTEIAKRLGVNRQHVASHRYKARLKGEPLPRTPYALARGATP